MRLSPRGSKYYTYFGSYISSKNIDSGNIIVYDEHGFSGSSVSSHGRLRLFYCIASVPIRLPEHLNRKKYFSSNGKELKSFDYYYGLQFD